MVIVYDWIVGEKLCGLVVVLIIFGFFWKVVRRNFVVVYGKVKGRKNYLFGFILFFVFYG